MGSHIALRRVAQVVREALGERLDSGLGRVVHRIASVCKSHPQVYYKHEVSLERSKRDARRVCDALLQAGVDDHGLILLMQHRRYKVC